MPASPLPPLPPLAPLDQRPEGGPDASPAEAPRREAPPKPNRALFRGRRDPQVPPGSVPTDQPSARLPRVLVVDDEPLMGKAIARLLADYDVFALTSARIAMGRIVAGERFDAILCDVMIPDFSGIDLYEGLAKHAPEMLHRLVFVTGGAYTAEAIAFLDRVPNRRLEKPLLPEDLQGAVASILNLADR